MIKSVNKEKILVETLCQRSNRNDYPADVHLKF